MNQFCKAAMVCAVSIAMLSVTICSAWAGYAPDGYDLGLVKSAKSLANSDVSIQTKALWGAYSTTSPVSTTLTLDTCQSISFGRLYLDIYSGTPYHTATLNATLNGHALSTLNIGGTGILDDANPSNRNPDATCVYGSGYGYWQIAYAGIEQYLNKDGTANTLQFSASTSDGFDGRIYGTTLVAVYSDPSIQHSLDYQLFEGDGYMRKTAGASDPKPQINLDRSFSISGVDTANVLSATYTAGYATGHSGQTDQIFFNNTGLELDKDIAIGGSATELHSFDVKDYLKETNSVLYSIDQSVLGGTGESSFHADVGLLSVTHTVPEPGAIVLLAVGAATLLLFLAKRRSLHEVL